MGKKILGLDLGPNSIGWALIDDGDTEKSGSLIDLGVRVFPEGLDAFDTGKEASRNEARRIARGMRRQTARRRLRRRRLINALTSIGLWPSDSQEHARLMALNPYELRAKAIAPDQDITLFELGRVFLNLARRRGFLSNRKTDRRDKEASGMLAEIQENEASRISSGQETIGAWLSEKLTLIDHRNRTADDHVRKRHLSRSQYRDEFGRIWEVQSKKYPQLLTDQLKYGTQGRTTYPCKPELSKNGPKNLLQQFGLDGLIFFQRKMYWRTAIIGRCELEPKKRRCPIADRRYQHFRIRQELNNLRYIDPDTQNECQLSNAQRDLLFKKLWEKEKLDFSQIRRVLGFLESVTFNLEERGKRSYLKGNATDHRIADKKNFGADWFDLSEDLRNEIVSALLDPNTDDREFTRMGIEQWGMSSEQVDRLLGIDLPTGYGSLSLKAIKRLLPHLDRGLTYSVKDTAASALHAAGYVRRDQLKRRLFDFLPSPQVVRNMPIGEVPNPVVKRTLTEVRKLVNAIIREYGKPDAIHLEMTRSLKMSSKKRQEVTSEMAKRARERESIVETLREHGQRPTRENILRYQLWKEQNHECIYSGKSISVAQLFGEGGGVEIDHILPRSRTLDDSQTNKVLCFRTANSDKGNRTPFEWLEAKSPQQYEEMLVRANHLLRSGHLTYTKYRKLLQKNVDTEDFVNRQLVDTAYITKVTGEYLKCLFQADHQVLGLKGILTAELRWQWGLETVLEELPDSPAWHAKSDLRPGEKNRADHRHHAIDAVVIALTNRSRLHSLAKSLGRLPSNSQGELLDEPWENFRQTISDRVAKIWVSHRSERKIRGALHEETLYGRTQSEGLWAVRKPIETLSANEIESIRDNAIRRLIEKRLQDAGIEFGRGSKIDPKKLKSALSNLKMPSGVPVNKVRITKPEQTIRPIRETKSISFVKPGSTHHLCIFEWTHRGKKKRDAVFVTMLEAINRSRRKIPIIDRDPPRNDPTIPPDARFVMSLSSREAVMIENNGQKHLLVFKTAASTQGQLYFAAHTDARKSNDYQKVVYRANTLLENTFVNKVTVDLLGRVRNSND